MDEIRKRDFRVFLKECMASQSLLPGFAVGLVVAFLPQPVWAATLEAIVAGGILAWAAYKRSIEHRFYNRRLRALWVDCEDRMNRLRAGLGKLKKQRFADLVELPKTIDNLGPQIYQALRRADIVAHEIYKSEKAHAPHVMQGQSARRITDTQAQELFSLADRNLAEYSSHFRAAIAGVERAEAQAVVFSTTLDTLRIRMLNYRLSAAQTETESLEFLHVINEAKLQFAAIDTALEELSEAAYPVLVAADPGSSRHPSQVREETTQDVQE